MVYILIACGGLSLALRAAEERLVSLGGVVSEILLDLEAGGRLVAVDESSALPESMADLPRVGYYRMISAEGVLSTRPTRVVATEDAGPPHALKQIRDAGVPVVMVSAGKTLAGAAERIRQVGEAVGRAEAAEALAAPLESRLRNPPEALASTPRVLFLYARGAGAPNVSGAGTGADEMIRLAGGVNAVDGFKGYRPLTPESLVAAAPDLVLATTLGLAAMGGPDAVWSLPGMAATPAGRSRRLVVMDDLFLLGFGPRTVEAADALRVKLEE